MQVDKSKASVHSCYTADVSRLANSITFVCEYFNFAVAQSHILPILALNSVPAVWSKSHRQFIFIQIIILVGPLLLGVPTRLKVETFTLCSFSDPH